MTGPRARRVKSRPARAEQRPQRRAGPRDLPSAIAHPGVIKTIAELTTWIAGIPRRQVTALPTPRHNFDDQQVDHDDFVSLAVFKWGYDAERRRATTSVLTGLAAQLHVYFMLAGGDIAWRVAPDIAYERCSMLMHADPDGPDYDPITDKWGWADSRFTAVKARARCACQCVGEPREIVVAGSVRLISIPRWKMIRVDRGNVVAIGHDPETHDVHVDLRRGGHQVYTGISAVAFAAMLDADDLGRRFHEHIRRAREA